MSNREIEPKDVAEFQRVAKTAKLVSIVYEDVSTSLSPSDADIAGSQAKRLAKKRAGDSPLSIEEDTDARLTAVKLNLVAGDRDSAVFGIIGLLGDRLSQLRTNPKECNADFQLVIIAQSMGIEDLSADSPIRLAFKEYTSLLQK
jgi:hypothetical protein